MYKPPSASQAQSVVKDPGSLGLQLNAHLFYPTPHGGNLTFIPKV